MAGMFSVLQENSTSRQAKTLVTDGTGNGHALLSAIRLSVISLKVCLRVLYLFNIIICNNSKSSRSS